MLTMQAIERARGAFDTLGIAPTVDHARIVQAFRTQAKLCHPDRFQDPSQKARCHDQFVVLTAARDLVLELIAHPNLIDVLAGHQPPDPEPTAEGAKAPSTPDDSTGSREGTAYEHEWRAFVDDENAYFRLMTSTRATALFVVHAGALGLGIGMALALQAVLFLAFLSISVTLLVAAISSSVAIPGPGWLIGIKLLIAIPGWLSSLSKSVRERLAHAADRTLRVVARTGFPTRAFWLSLLAAVTLAASVTAWLYATHRDLLGGASFATTATMTIAMLMVYDRIHTRLANMDAAFDSIRNTRSYALMVRAA
jgi:hypothetical protein